MPYSGTSPLANRKARIDATTSSDSPPRPMTRSLLRSVIPTDDLSDIHIWTSRDWLTAVHTIVATASTDDGGTSGCVSSESMISVNPFSRWKYTKSEWGFAPTSMRQRDRISCTVRSSSIGRIRMRTSVGSTFVSMASRSRVGRIRVRMDTELATVEN